MRRRGPSTGRGTGCASLWPLLLLLTAAGVHTPGTAAAPAPVATAAPSEQSPATAWRSPFAALRNTDVLFEAAVRSNPQCHTDLARTYMTDACDPEHFTVIITTGGSRLPALKKVLDSYRRSKLVDKIILIWNNPSEPVAALKQEKLYIMSSPSRSLNNRFLPMYNVTTCAVLNTDDDIVLRKHSDMAFMFRVWQGHPSSLVGPFARNAGKAYTSDYLPAHRDGDKFYMYNVVLTNYAMLHRFWFFAYSCLMRQAAWDLVEELQNGEDITMNFMATGVTGLPPMQVMLDGDIVNYGLYDGISAGASHVPKRNRCYQALLQVFGRDYYLHNYAVLHRARCRPDGMCIGQPTNVLDYMPNGTYVRTGHRRLMYDD